MVRFWGRILGSIFVDKFLGSVFEDEFSCPFLGVTNF